MSVHVFVIDGPDAVGKTTLIDKLVAYFNSNTSYDAVKLSPSSTGFGSAIKQLVLTTPNISRRLEKLLFHAGMVRVADEIETLKQTYSENKELIVFIDRWLDSHTVYQNYLHQGRLDIDEYKDVPYPDKTILLDASDELLDKRLLEERTEKDKYEDLTLQQRVRYGYRLLANNSYRRNNIIQVMVEGTVEENLKQLTGIVIRELLK